RRMAGPVPAACAVVPYAGRGDAVARLARRLFKGEIHGARIRGPGGAPSSAHSRKYSNDRPDEPVGRTVRTASQGRGPTGENRDSSRPAAGNRNGEGTRGRRHLRALHVESAAGRGR